MSESESAVNVLDLREVSLCAGEGRTELDRFSLSLVPGERVVVLGERGSGKEALFRLLGGYAAKDEIIGGAVAVRGGVPVPAAEDWRGDLAIAYLPAARSSPFAPHASVLKQLCRAVAGATHAPLASAREELRLALARHDAAPDIAALDAKPDAIDSCNLAWGLLALSVCRNPDLLLADHAFSDLGPRAVAMLIAALEREQQRAGFALLYATGSMQVVARLSGRIVVLRQGRIVEEGTREKLESGQAHAYTRTLFKAMPQLRPDAAPVRAHARGQPLLQVYGLSLDKQQKRRAGKARKAQPSHGSAMGGLTFEVARGGAIAFVGEDGSGRKDMARAILGLDPPSRGRVVFDAVNLGILSQEMRSRLRRRIAFITGSDETLDPGMSLFETVEEPLRTHLGISGDLIAGYRDGALKRVGLASLNGRTKIKDLSPFDRRRLQIARAMVASPLLAVIDEPLRGLDAFAQGVVRELLADMRTQSEAAFLVITADFTVAKALAGEVFVFKDGKIVERGPMAEVLKKPKEDITRELIAAVSQ